MMIYDKYYPLASAAGRFLSSFISEMSEDEIGVIKSVIRFSKMPRVFFNVLSRFRIYCAFFVILGRTYATITSRVPYGLCSRIAFL